MIGFIGALYIIGLVFITVVAVDIFLSGSGGGEEEGECVIDPEGDGEECLLDEDGNPVMIIECEEGDEECEAEAAE